MTSKLDDLVGQLARNRNIDEPQATAEGRFIFELDGELTIVVSQSVDRILLEATLGPIPEDSNQAESLLCGLLREQMASVSDEEETLSLDPDTDDLVIYRRLNASTATLAELEQALESIANLLEKGIDALAANKKPRTAAPPLHYLMP